MPRIGPFCVPLTTTRTTTWSPWPKMSSMVMCASGNAATTPANSPATLALPETVPTVPPYHCMSGSEEVGRGTAVVLIDDVLEERFHHVLVCLDGPGAAPRRRRR